MRHFFTVMVAAVLVLCSALLVEALLGRRNTSRSRPRPSKLRIALARGWHNVYWIIYRASLLRSRYGSVAGSAALVLLMALTGYYVPSLQRLLNSDASPEAASRFSDLMMAVGGALIGATAIVFALVMFAIQVNVDRAPHGVFRKLSSDRGLLGAFFGSLLLAGTVAALSLIPSPSLLAATVWTAVWAIVWMMVLFLSAYRRALSLISPMAQLRIIVAAAEEDLSAWARRAQRAGPLLESQIDDPEAVAERSQHDLARTAYFASNPHWTDEASRAVQHAVSYSRSFSQRGDYDVSASALISVLRICGAYIDAKGRTFYSSSPFLDNPFSTDSFLNDVLEHMRQNVRIGCSRGDERQIEQTLQTIESLVALFLGIDYRSDFAHKTHANLAAAYLSSAAESILPHGMPDVLMEWMRLVGSSSQRFVNAGAPDQSTSLVEKIGVVAAASSANEAYRPVTLVGVEQLAQLTLALLSGSRDPDFALSKVRGNLKLVAAAVLQVPDGPLTDHHSTYLAPYYSATSATAFPYRFATMANVLVRASADDETAQRAIEYIAEWSEDLSSEQKDTLVLAVEKRSNATFHVVHWICKVVEVLAMLSNAPACGNPAELRRKALWLAWTLSWLPHDEGSVNLVRVYVLETIFECAAHAQESECTEIAIELSNLQLGWAGEGR